MRTARKILMGALLALTAVTLISCGPSEGDRAAQASGPMTLHRGNNAEPETLDPSQSIANWEDNIIGDMLVGLMTYDINAKPIPGAATSWETSADGLTWTFHLRDHQWSDGKPVTAEDFVFAWQRLLNPETHAKYAYFLYLIKNAKAVHAGKMPLSALGARAVDAKTVEITLEYPVPYLLELLTHITTYPLPKHVVEAKGKDWVKPGNYVGNGPYIVSEWAPNDHVTSKKNPRFYDAANVKVEEVTYYPTSDYDAALRRFRAGELDTQGRLPANQIGWMKANMPNAMDPVPQTTLEYFVVNFKRKPFGDVRVREALNLALDRETVTEKIRKLGEPPAYNFIPPGMANFPHTNAFDFKAMPYAERVKKAQALMQAAGYGPNNRVRTTLMLRATSNDIERQVAAAVQQMWKAIYIDIEIVPQDTAIFYNKMEEHDFDIGKPAWGADFNDASNFLDLLRTGVGNNYTQYSSATFDALMDKAQFETDLVARGKILAEAEAVAMKDQAWMPLLFWVAMDIKHPYVSGYKNNAGNSNRTRWISVDMQARAKQFSR